MRRSNYKGAASARTKRGGVSLHVIVPAELAAAIRAIASKEETTLSEMTRALLQFAVDDRANG